MTGAVIVVSPPDRPLVANIKQLLSTPTVSFLIRVEAGALDDLDQAIADAYLAAGAYLILDFADVRDAVELQRRAGVICGPIQ